MRILHTSDWHLGRSFGTYGLLPDQEVFLDWLVATSIARSVDLVVVAGDIYDRSSPPAEAIRAFDRTVGSLNRAGIEIAAIAGNHDAPERVAVYSAFTENSGLVLRGGYPSGGDIVIRDFADGPLAIAAIPFLDPRMIPPGFDLLDSDDGPFTHNTVLAACAEAAADAIPEGMRSLAIAHGFIAGGKGSDSEKLLVAAVGGSDHIGAECFAPFSYTALGHLHKPQTVRSCDTIRYSGSPLPYSFGETQQKSVVLVSMDHAGECGIELIDVPVGRGVRTIRDEFANLANYDRDTDHLVRIELTDVTPVRDAKRRLDAIFPHIIELSLVNLRATAGRTYTSDSSRSSLAHQVKDFLEVATGETARLDYFDLIIDALGAVGADLEFVDDVRGNLTDQPAPSRPGEAA